MNDRERAVNEDLHALGRAYRLGQLQREEYRARRRHVMSGLRASDDVDTARKPLIGANSGIEVLLASGSRYSPEPLSGSTAADRAPPAKITASSEVGNSSSGATKYGVLIGIGSLVVAGAVALLLRSPDKQPSVSAATPVAATDALGELEAATSRFTDLDDWQPIAVDAWLSVWQRADLSVRRAALGRPAVQRLRDQASYRLSVRKALVPADAEVAAGATETESIERLLRTIDAPD